MEEELECGTDRGREGVVDLGRAVTLVLRCSPVQVGGGRSSNAEGPNERLVMCGGVEESAGGL